MAMIYDLNWEAGGVIIADTDTTNPALTISGGVGGGLAFVSVATGIALDVTTVASPSARFRSAASTGNALSVGRTVASGPTAASILFAHVSAASAPVMEFIPGGGFVSVTSVILTTVANIKGVIRVKAGDVMYNIPCILDAGLVGTGVF